MKELLELTVTQIRIFPNDALGYRYFRRQSSMDAISGAFALDPQPTFPDGFPVALNKVVFGAGEFRDGSGRYDYDARN